MDNVLALSGLGTGREGVWLWGKVTVQISKTIKPRVRFLAWHLLQNLPEEKKVVFIKNINIHAAW